MPSISTLRRFPFPPCPTSPTNEPAKAEGEESQMPEEGAAPSSGTSIPRRTEAAPVCRGRFVCELPVDLHAAMCRESPARARAPPRALIPRAFQRPCPLIGHRFSGGKAARTTHLPPPTCPPHPAQPGSTGFPAAGFGRKPPRRKHCRCQRKGRPLPPAPQAASSSHRRIPHGRAPDTMVSESLTGIN